MKNIPLWENKSIAENAFKQDKNEKTTAVEIHSGYGFNLPDYFASHSSAFLADMHLISSFL